ncbi:MULTISPECIES: hypothetical protein [unclassified Streptomyces]|uniref:hypothetical protein n=1 Tax=unclassified Streptomyces TaxID=2593676 RepID=UPI000823C05E|nr:MULTISPECIES: hypothetical protein [unclassified Streptomyces]MYT98335.1 hypothetical protein [Streptomyces sp. SID8350]SCK28688.1 hypothetical protein YUWDRAFT_02121 [Streptomyces sp. AmelKG-D3]
MRDSIFRALLWTLRLLLPAEGRHAAEQPVTPTVPVPPSPWSRPWTAPSAREVREIFRDEHTRQLPAPQRERSYAAAFARIGVDYDHPTMPLGSLVRRERVAA